MIEAHPLTKHLPERANFDDLVMHIAHNGQERDIVLYETKIVEGRVRYRACLEAGIEHPRTRNWVMFADEKDDPLDWMIRTYVADHEPDELDRIRITASVLPHYHDLPGATHERLALSIGLSQRKVRYVDWIGEANLLGPVLSGEKNIGDVAAELGFTSQRREGALGKVFGKGDKFDLATAPLKRYLAAWQRRNYEFRHVNPKEAARRLKTIDLLIEQLQHAREDIERRSHRATPPVR